MNQVPPFDLTRLGERRASTTSPIYTRDAGGRVQGVGTGVFVAHRGCAFVLTASHVLREYIDTDELLIGGRLVVRLNQRFFPSTDEDTYDVGFVPLTDEQRAVLADVTFVTIENVDLSDDCGPLPYYVVGYRSDDNAPEGVPTTLVAAWSVYAARSATPEMYAERRLSQIDRLLLMFDRHRLYGPDGPVETESAPEGMSGSGVWRITPDPESDMLTAIVESHTDNGKLIYAARLRILMQSLDAYAEGRLS